MESGDDDDEDVFRRQCVGCGAWSPATRTQHTLISARFGWRLTRRTGDDGKIVVEWRCPTCFAKLRSSTPDDGGPPSSSKK
ncbi:MAG: hypothetical protein U0271_23115 [Polyangiaceae bacterium]